MPALILGAALTAAAFAACAAESVFINTNVTFQTVRSWGAPAGLIGNPESLMDPLLDELVHTLGLNRLRFEPPRREWEAALNDNADPALAVPAAFEKTGTDLRVARVFVPFKQRVEADGDRFEFYVSPSFFDSGSSGTAPAWLLNSPGEYAEWATQFLLHLRSRHNLHADFYSICNEAGNNNAFSASLVASMIKTLAPRLEALGFRTRIQFPECVSADSAWSYIQSTQADAEMWRWVSLVSYHLYGGNNSRPQIRDFAWARGLPTGQTEYMGLNLDRLYDDLTLGGVSTWEYYALNDILTVNSSRTWFSRTQTFWRTRQVLRYVRAGAVRVDATSSTNALRPLAFVRDGRPTLVLINTTDGAYRSVEVTGLSPGSYGRVQVVGSGPAQELGLVTVAAPGPLTVDVPANAVLTLYPHAGGNLPPCPTSWAASPMHLVQPAHTATLSAAAIDPETNLLSYAWSVQNAPPGALVRLVSPATASCTVTGLVAAGDYLFEVTINDGANTVARRLPLQVVSGNQPPELLDVHNRLPVTVTLPTDSTTLRSGGRDLEGDALTYQWSVVSQPAGAAATLLTPAASACIATNLAAAGDYVFRIVLNDPTRAVSNDLRVTVYPTNRAPVISSAGASPSSLTLPASSVVLTAVCSDPDNDPVSYWWSVNSAPSGALPVFSHAGSNVTSVAGLILPGSYTFKLTAVDRAGVATRTVALTVNAGSNPALLFLASPNGGETYSARQTITIRWAASQVAGDVSLEFNDGISGWAPIAVSTPNDGVESWTLPHGSFSGCRVRIAAVGNGVVADESDGTFSVSVSTPRFLGIAVSNRVPVLQFETEPGLANFLQRRVVSPPDAQWETLPVPGNGSQNVIWPDAAAASLPGATYRIIAP